MKQLRILFCFIVISISLSGCSLWSSMFNDDDDEVKIEPAKLVKIEEEVSLNQQWSISVGKGQGKKYNRLTPAIDGDLIYVASNNGKVIAVNRETGREVWEVELEEVFTGGVGVGDNLLLLGTENAQVLALDKQTGSVKWRSEVSSEVLSAPATNDEFVVVQAVDGKITGLNAETGEQEWIYESTVPNLSLRGESSPLVSGNMVIAALANGTVVSISIEDGTLRWDERVAIPTGRSDIERLVDIDGELHINGNLLLVPSYQGYFVAIDITTGQTRWRVKESSTTGASSGFGNFYISDERSHVKAYRNGQEDTTWENADLDLRQISGPTSFGNYIAVTDFEGYLHILSQVDGRIVGRTRIDRKGVRSQILSDGNTLYIYGNSGKLIAMNVQ